MIAITWIHIAAGMIALGAGGTAVAVRKGGPMHASAGTWFCVTMFVLGVTAAIMGPFKTPPESPVGGIMVCYFIATAWMTARRRSGVAGTFEKIACAAMVVISTLIIIGGFQALGAPSAGPPGQEALFAVGGFCALAALLDLSFIIRRKLTPTQRISRHLWRMCFAFFIATGSFFLGQQDTMPEAVRGSPVLWVLALAPFALMLFWLVRVRFSKMLGRLKLASPAPGVAKVAPHTISKQPA